MTDYYQTLGVSEAASPEEIKKAYRSLANKHHPDKGGDQAVFKDISVAYDTLSNPQKKAEYDQQRQYGGGPQFHFNTGGGFDPFGHMFGQGFGGGHPFGDIFGQARGLRRNRDLNIQCQITLLDSFQGKQLEAKYQMPSGKLQTVAINIPAGVNHGDNIRYQGLGDDSVPNAPRGNLNITVIVIPDSNYSRNGDDLYTKIFINPIEAIIGCQKQVQSITGESVMVDIRAGVETGVEYAMHGRGFKNLNNGSVGRFVSVIHIKTPTVTDPAIIAELQRINQSIR